MARTVVPVVCLAALLTGPAPAVAADGSAPAASKRPPLRELTLYTDSMPTKVTVSTADGRVGCVRVVTGDGRDRRVWLELTNAARSRTSLRVRPRSRSACQLVGAAAPAGTRLLVVVEEDVLGPFDPSDEGSLSLSSRSAVAAAR